METAYRKSPTKALTSAQLINNENEEQTDTVVKVKGDTKEDTAAAAPAKSLLTSKQDNQEVV